MTKISTALTIFVLLVTTVAEEYPPGPVPYCSSRPIMPILPLTINEVITTDISKYFSGYNLEIIL
jgi:hypothetical protein